MKYEAEKVKRYAALLERLAVRAEDMLQKGDVSSGTCEVMVQLYNQYAEEVSVMFEQDELLFSKVSSTGECLETQLTEVMLRSEHLASWLGAVEGQSKSMKLEIPPMPDVSRLVNRKRAEDFAAEVDNWARTVGHKAEEFSREISERVPRMVNRYVKTAEPEPPTPPQVSRQTRSKVLSKVRDGELTVDEALVLLGHTEGEKNLQNQDDSPQCSESDCE